MAGLCENCMEREARSVYDLFCDPCEISLHPGRYPGLESSPPGAGDADLRLSRERDRADFWAGEFDVAHKMVKDLMAERDQLKIAIDAATEMLRDMAQAVREALAAYDNDKNLGHDRYQLRLERKMAALQEAVDARPAVPGPDKEWVALSEPSFARDWEDEPAVPGPVPGGEVERLRAAAQDFLNEVDGAFLCPTAYVAKRRLEKALALTPAPAATEGE